MIIHSIVPVDKIFNTDVSINHNEIINFGQIQLEVRNIGNKDYEVVRIISTDPNDYLRPDIQPGSIIKTHYIPGEK